MITLQINFIMYSPISTLISNRTVAENYILSTKEYDVINYDGG